MSTLSSSHQIHYSKRARSRYLERNARGWVAPRSGVCARQCLIVLLLFISGSMSALAMPLAEYRSRIHQSVAELESVMKSASSEAAPLHVQRLNRALDKLRRVVPQEETVEFEGDKVRVDNSWIEEELQEFQQVPPYDTRGTEILERIIERLRALDDRLTELEPHGATTTIPTASEDKAQEKEQLKKVLSRAEFKPTPPEKNVFQRIWESIVKWWNSLFGGGGSLGSGQSSWFSFIALILVLGLAASAISYAIWKLILLLQSRRGTRRSEKKEARILLGERLAPDQKASDLLAEAEALAHKGEIRAAIRKAYIALLCELGDRKILTLAEHKTNRDYLRALRQKRPLLAGVQKLTNSFEDHWYGFRQATTDDWTAFRTGYQQTLKTVTGDK